MASEIFDPSKIVIMANAHDTLKNDAVATTSVTLPGNTPIPANDRLLISSDMTIGAAGSIADIRLQSSKEGSVYFLASVLKYFERVDGDANPYFVYAGAFHVDATTLRVQAFAVNPYSLAMTAPRGDETFTFKIRTYKAPF